MGWSVTLGDTVPIVEFFRTVEANSDDKVFFRQKAAPVLIEEGPIGLHAVDDMLVRRLMLALERYNLAKVVQPQNCRLPAVPREVDHRTGGSLDVLDNILLQDVVGHAKRLVLWIKVFFIQVVTVVTPEVTERTSRFDKNLKLAGSFGHCSKELAFSEWIIVKHTAHPVKTGQARLGLPGNVNMITQSASAYKARYPVDLPVE